jgi:NitT/TauT family transport system substrate-binding protein
MDERVSAGEKMKATLFACLLLVDCTAKSDRPQVHLGVLGVGLQTMQLPITLAQTLGYYKDEGVDVKLENITTNAKTLQALVGGSVDVAGLAYQQTILMAAEGQHVRAFFICVNRTSTVLAVTPKAHDRIRRVEDLKGAVIGVPSLGSPTHTWVNYILNKHGVHASDVSNVAIGTGAPSIAAVESGRIDAVGLSGGDHLRLLKRDPTLRILVDGSTPEGMRETYGRDTCASGALSAKQAWVDRNPETARKLARALQRTLRWMAAHSAEEIYAVMPENLRSQDAAMDIEVIRWSLPQLTADGAMPKGAPEATRRFLDATIDKVRDSKIDLAATWTNEYLPGAK